LIPSALMLPTLSPEIVAYLALFATVGFLFVLASLLLGKFLRADAPTPQKLDTYECGEPAVGPGTVQFDLRFYVVALLFLIFEVEVALFFPPAVVFGKAAQARVASRRVIPLVDRKTIVSLPDRMSDDSAQARSESHRNLAEPPAGIAAEPSRNEDPAMSDAGQEIGMPDGQIAWSPASSRSVALFAMADLGVFFAVVLVGFAFVWRRGDLDWVRAVRHPATPAETAAWMSRMRRSGY
jgi:NADH-quinone oxidoreductase subunit A